MEARIAELQPMAECRHHGLAPATSRMRGPDVGGYAGSWDEYLELFVCAGVDLRSFQHGNTFLRWPAPAPAVQDFSLMHGGIAALRATTM